MTSLLSMCMVTLMFSIALVHSSEPSCPAVQGHDQLSMLQVSMSQHKESPKAQQSDSITTDTKGEAMDSEKGKIIDIEDLKMEAFMDGMRLPNQQEKAELLRLTNIYRCMHGSSDLEWSNTLASEVNSYISPMTKMVHDPNNKNSGENIYITTGQADAGEAVSMWYNEVNDCATGGPKSFTDGCMTEKPGTMVGHFTSMIWKGAQTLGCAYSSNNKLIMCRYGGGNRDEITHDLEIDKGGGSFGIYKAKCNSANMRFHESYGAKDTCYVQQVGHLQKTKAQCSSSSSPASSSPSARSKPASSSPSARSKPASSSPSARSKPASSSSSARSKPPGSSSRSGGQGGGSTSPVASGPITITALTGVPKIEKALKDAGCPDDTMAGWLKKIREKLGAIGANVQVSVMVTASPGKAEIQVTTTTKTTTETAKGTSTSTSTSTSTMSGTW